MVKDLQATYTADICKVADKLQRMPQVDMPVKHMFAPGVYYREIFVPAGTLIIGHNHKTEYLNILIKGKCRIFMAGKVKEMDAPCTFVSDAGVQKMAYVLEDMIFATIHPTEETDHEVIEAQLVDKAPEWHEYQEELKLLRKDL